MIREPVIDTPDRVFSRRSFRNQEFIVWRIERESSIRSYLSRCGQK